MNINWIITESYLIFETTSFGVKLAPAFCLHAFFNIFIVHIFTFLIFTNNDSDFSHSIAKCQSIVINNLPCIHFNIENYICIGWSKSNVILCIALLMCTVFLEMGYQNLYNNNFLIKFRWILVMKTIYLRPLETLYICVYAS